jgi:hypothetical protein
VEKVFFPGYAVMPDTLVGMRGPAKIWDSQVAVDHLSLEKDRESCGHQIANLRPWAARSSWSHARAV